MKLYIKFLKEYLLNKKNIKPVIIIILIILFTSTFSFSNIIISKLFINSISYSKNNSSLIVLGIISIGLITINILINLLQNVFINKYVQKICLQMRIKFFKTIQKMSWNSLDNLEVGELQFRLFSDISIITENASLLPLNLITSIFFVLIINIFSLIINWRILILLDLLLFINGVLYFFLQKNMEKYSKKLQEDSEALYSYSEEQLNYIKLMQLYNTQSKEAYTLFSYLKKYYTSITNKNIFSNNSNLIATAFTSLLNIGILWIGGTAVISNSMTLGDLVAFLSIISFIIPISSQISSSILHYPIYTVSLKRIYEIFDLIPNNSLDRTKEIQLNSGNIIFDNVTFSYNKNNENVLNNISFKVLSNKINLLIGDSGLGKSTIFKLILNIYSDYSGNIFIDDINAKSFNLKSLKNQILYAGTYAPLIQDTIYNNITYGCKNFTYEDVIRVSKLACIVDKIESLPNGFFTTLGSRGIELSDGEKQRLMLARALLNSPPILLLDEITANLDKNTEEKIMKNLQGLLNKSTILFISHREIPKKYADNIINLNILYNNGRCNDHE